MTTTTTDQDVQVDNPTTGEIYPSQVRDHAAALDGAATDTRFVPADPYAADRCGIDGCRQIHVGALIEPTIDEGSGDGDVLIELVRGVDARPGWPTWQGDVHQAEMQWSELMADLRTWPDVHRRDATVWDDELRALCGPARVSQAYLDSPARLTAQMVLAGRQDTVYAGLAPERLDAAVQAARDAAEREVRAEREARAEHDRHAELMTAFNRRHGIAGADVTADVRRVNQSLRRVDQDSTIDDAEPDGWVAATWWRRRDALAIGSGGAGTGSDEPGWWSRLADRIGRIGWGR